MIDVEEYSDEEWVDEEYDGDEQDDLLTCPSCRHSVHEDTQQCPHCGDWITPIDASGSAKRMIWLVAAALVILSMILYTVL